MNNTVEQIIEELKKICIALPEGKPKTMCGMIAAVQHGYDARLATAKAGQKTCQDDMYKYKAAVLAERIQSNVNMQKCQSDLQKADEKLQASPMPEQKTNVLPWVLLAVACAALLALMASKKK